MAFYPYIVLSGTTREAFTRYQEIFGGELYVMTMGDAPEGEEVPPDVDPDMVMHASLMFGDNLLMGSDDPAGDGGPIQGLAVNYSTPDVDEAKRVFEALAEGGEVEMPITETFWSPAFGSCKDRFGVPWLVGADAPASEG